MKRYSSTLNIFDSGGDFTRPSSAILAKELIPLNNNQHERFQTDALINGKTRYEEENTIIKSLEEEIVTMKHKLSFVYEKDEEISKLKEQLYQFKKSTKELEGLSKDSSQLRLDNKQLKDEIDLLRLHKNDLDKLTSENKLLRVRLSQLSTDDDDESEDIEDIEEIERIEEMIDVNIPQLRHVLFSRLKDKQIQHIEGLITSYGLKKKNKVKRSLMERLLEEAIHL